MSGSSFPWVGQVKNSDCTVLLFWGTERTKYLQTFLKSLIHAFKSKFKIVLMKFWKLIRLLLLELNSCVCVYICMYSAHPYIQVGNSIWFLLPLVQRHGGIDLLMENELDICQHHMPIFRRSNQREKYLFQVDLGSSQQHLNRFIKTLIAVSALSQQQGLFFPLLTSIPMQELGG